MMTPYGDRAPEGGLGEPSRRVLLEVLRRGPVSRTELADRLGLSLGSLSRLTAPLIDGGLIEQRTARSPIGAGRPQVPLVVRAEAQSFIGISVTAENLDVVITDMNAQPLRVYHAPLASSQPEHVVAQAATAIGGLSTGIGRSDGPPDTQICVAVGGSSPDGRLVTSAPYLGWENVPLADLMERATGLTCLVENDLAALTDAENWFGAGREHERFIVVTTGSGIGFGAVVAGRPLSGADLGFAPSARVFVTGFDGVPVRVSEAAAIPAITERATAAFGETVAFDEVLLRARAADPIAGTIVAAAAEALGEFIATAAAFTLPEIVVVSGEGAQLVDVAPESLAEGIARVRHPLSAPLNLQIRDNDFGYWARGAASLAIVTSLVRL